MKRWSYTVVSGRLLGIGTMEATMRRLVLTASVLALAGCGGGSGGGGTSGGTTGGATGGATGGGATFTGVKGVVLDTEGNPISGAFVDLVGDPSEYMSTGDDGAFTLPFPPGADIPLSSSKSGYAPQWRNVTIQQGGTTWIELRLLKLADPQPLDAAAGGTVTANRGAAIVAGAGVFVDGDGNAITGTINVAMQHFDPGVAEELAAAPAPLDSVGGEGGLLESYGMIHVELTNSETGSSVSIADGETVELRFPAPSNTAERPESIPLWSASAAKWFAGGEATYDAGTDQYVAQVSHFSTWNIDKVASATCVRGRALDTDGEPVAGAFVFAKGIDYSGSSSATSKPDGEFCVPVRQNSKVEITVYGYDGAGQAKEVDTWEKPSPVPPICDDPSCKDEGDWTVTGAPAGGGTTGGTTGGATGGGGSNNAACGLVANLDPCLDGLTSIFTCFDPSGECTLSGGGIQWANGASLEGNALKKNGTLCGTMETTPDTKTIDFSTPDGQTWRVASLDNDDSVVTCPNGTEVSVTATQQEAFQQCAGGATDTTTGPCLGGLGGGACSSNSDCSSGQVCCDFGNGVPKVCLIEQACQTP